MKKFVAIISILASVFSVKAQYIKMPLDSNHFWKQFNWNWYSQSSPRLQTTYQLCYRYDTLINQKQYHKITTFGPKTIDFQGEFIVVKTGYLRQDTILKQIYYYNKLTNSEFVLYDFSKNIGDTLKNISALADPYKSNNQTNLIISNVDSLLLNDGKKHKRFFLRYYNNTSSTFEIIEGVGSTKGLLNPYYVTISSPDNHIVCHGVITPFLSIYSKSNAGANCDFTTTIDEIPHLKLNSRVYPNPTTGNLFVESSHSKLDKVKIKIFGFTGAEVLYQRITDSEINIEFLPMGVYSILIDVGDRSERFTIIKE